MTESPVPPADPNSTPEDPSGAPAPNPGEDPGTTHPPADPYTRTDSAVQTSQGDPVDPVRTAPEADAGQGDPVDPVQEGAPATGPEAPEPPFGD
jgi:hypothetical protein